MLGASRHGIIMDLKEAVAVARRQISDLFASDAPRNIRLEGFLYDDHLMVWSLTIGFDPVNHAAEASMPIRQPRSFKIVRVSEADKSVLSVSDR
jgi:hypothetical protein